jgi:hypothetical protein
MLPKEAVIIIAVCSAITTLFIVLIIIRRYSRPSTPLPSIQPLAHHRVQLVQQLQNPSIHIVVPSTTSKHLPISADPHSKIESHSAASCSTKNSRVPHGPLSEMEIVLPVPLALNVRRGAATKYVVADRWTSGGTGKKISSSSESAWHLFSHRSDVIGVI